jgi:hypothetical protein
MAAENSAETTRLVNRASCEMISPDPVDLAEPADAQPCGQYAVKSSVKALAIYRFSQVERYGGLCRMTGLIICQSQGRW